MESVLKATLGLLLIIGFLMGKSIPNYHQKELKNGLTALVVPLQNGSGVINTDIFYRVGSRDEIMGKSGIAHMLEHLNFKSTKNLEAGEFDQIVKGFGGLNNASTSFDLTHYFIRSSSENLDRSLELFAELMENLALKDEEFQPERDVVLEERYWRTDNSPFGLLYFTIFNTAFVHHSYHWTPIGFIDDIKGWSIEDIRNFWERYYQPQNAFIVVAGDIEPEEAFKKIEARFGKIANRTEKIERRDIKEPSQLGAKRVEIEKESDVEYLAIAFRIPNFLHEDQVGLSVISEILSSGRSSRLYRNFVVEKSLANSIYAYNIDGIDENLFLFLAVGNGGVKAEDLEKELWSEIEKLKSSQVSERELNKVKINVKSDFIYSFETASSTADIFGEYLAKGSLEPLLDYEERVEKLSPDTLKEIANRYFVRKNSTTVIYRSGEEKK
jgi:zinc protease